MKPNCSPAGTDLRIDWADACSLGCQGERYFLLIVDKDTEYLVNFNTAGPNENGRKANPPKTKDTKTRQNPVDLLRSYINTTGKKPRYLRVGPKERARTFTRGCGRGRSFSLPVRSSNC